ncbi:hypothetical protein L484_018189 [Morus notabilis]|uniref:Uncharacterized protein n=1 Tax=Morus notabilis TaxID=981085 RepID=W9R9S6_9ROSA|nr:hypothetical protein L484_018189 [Morus notabilis]
MNGASFFTPPRCLFFFIFSLHTEVKLGFLLSTAAPSILSTTAPSLHGDPLFLSKVTHPCGLASSSSSSSFFSVSSPSDSALGKSRSSHSFVKFGLRDVKFLARSQLRFRILTVKMFLKDDSLVNSRESGLTTSNYSELSHLYEKYKTQVSYKVAGKLEAISAMPVYKDKSHEELRWEDYQLGDKGGSTPTAQSTGIFSSSTSQPSVLGPSPSFTQSSSSLFSNTTSNLFAPKPPVFSSTEDSREDGLVQEKVNLVKVNQKSNEGHDDHNIISF